MGKSIETESRCVVAKGWGEEGGWTVIAKGCQMSFWGDENSLGLEGWSPSTVKVLYDTELHI